MKTRFNNSELCHVWAHQTQSHGKGSSMFFEGSRIYSYGYHFIIADKINYKGKGAFLINKESYSNSTAKHQSHVWRSIPSNVPYFRVAVFPSSLDNNWQHEKNLNYYLNEAQNTKDKIKTASKHKEGYLNQTLNSIDIFTKYVQFFDIDLTNSIDSTINKRYLELTEFCQTFANSVEFLTWQQKQAEQLKIKEAKILEQKAESIELFRAFKISSVYGIGVNLLRLNKETETIETSGGVKMPLTVFMEAFNRFASNTLQIGQHIGIYTYNGIKDGVLSVGCHKIPVQEVENVVKYI